MSVVTGFSLVGIALGVAALIVVMAVMSGFREELLSRILGVTGHGVISGQNISLQQALSAQQNLLQVPGIVSAQPFVYGQGLVMAGRTATGVVVRGVVPTDDNLFQHNVVAGEADSLNTPFNIAIGNGLAEKLGVQVGDTLTLLSPEGNRTIMGFMPRMQSVQVGLVFNIGMYQYDTSLIYMNITDAQKFFKLGNTVSAVEFKVQDPENIRNYTPTILNIVGEKALVSDWMQTNRQFFDALQVEKVAMFIILALVMVVAAFNIVTGQTMLVNDKRGDIAILRTMGARRRDVLRIFFLNGLLLGSIGTLSGLGLGLLVVTYLHPIVQVIELVTGASIFSGEVYFLDTLPTKLVYADISFIVGLSVLLTILSSLHPAYAAAKTNPVEVLRHE